MNSPTARKQIIFVDSAVEDYQHLLDGVESEAKIVILDDRLSGIAQITQVLAAESNIAAIHIISHGSPGKIELGREKVDRDYLEKFSTQLQQWRNAFTAKANILLYGCEIAARETGKNFIKRFSELAGVSIAASATPTGSSELGGDWKLEVQTGAIEAAVTFHPNTLKTYSGVLGFATYVTFATGISPYSVSIGDINGDGKPDLAVANAGSNSASILLNTTTAGATPPTFSPQVTFATDRYPYSVSIDDINGDGKP
ncbi:MAG: DUF4347 domain-containing protein, partial [Microcoleus sp.]